MESITLVDTLPAGSAAGENVALASAGRPETLNMMVLPSVPFKGATIRPKLAGLPAVTLALAVGTATVKSPTVNSRALVKPPPGDGLLTTMLKFPLCVKSLAGSAAVSDVGLTYVVGRDEPFTSTIEELLKFVPVMVTFRPALSGPTLVGERLLAVGTGLLTVNVVTRDALPPGFVTVTSRLPATAMAPAGMAAVNCVGLS
jgi:hypothetical protein